MDGEETDSGTGRAPHEPKQPSGRLRGIFQVTPGKPIEIIKSEPDSPDSHYQEEPPESKAIGNTLKAYREAAKSLLAGKYRDLIDVVPPHLRTPCDCLALVCDDGIIVRWDKHAGDAPKVRTGAMLEEPRTVPVLAPRLSEGLVHCPTDSGVFELPSDSPRLQLSTGVLGSGERQVIVDSPIGIVINWGDLQNQSLADPSRPMPLVSVTNEFEIQIEGEMFDEATDPKPGTGQQFITNSRMRWSFGWEAFEIYPPFNPAVWVPTQAPLWAELDILASATRYSLKAQMFNTLDPRAAARKEFTGLLKEFQSLLDGDEASLQSFLETNPALLSPIQTRTWRKVPLGRRITDFIFREPGNEYVLVELEAPTQSLFRKDGQPHENFVHARDQVTDWIRYIEDNHATVQTELGLAGISTNPRCLIVIGRSRNLTAHNRRKLTTLQNLSPKLQIMTYDDLFATGKAAIENLLGPLWETAGTADIYYLWGSSR